MVGNAVGRSDLELFADLGDRRGEALFPNGLEQEIVDRFLPVGERGQHEKTYTENDFSSQEAARSASSSRSGRSTGFKCAAIVPGFKSSKRSPDSLQGKSDGYRYAPPILQINCCGGGSLS